MLDVMLEVLLKFLKIIKDLPMSKMMYYELDVTPVFRYLIVHSQTS